jgi:histidine ammonia-lyase
MGWRGVVQAPLSHLALGLMGEGNMWDTATGTIKPASEVLMQNGLRPISLGAKEGLALINGGCFYKHLCTLIKGR